MMRQYVELIACRSGLLRLALEWLVAAIALVRLPTAGWADTPDQLLAGPPTVLKPPAINDSIGNPVHCLAFAGGGSQLVTGATSGVLIWDVSSGDLRQTLELDERAVDSVALDPHGALLVAGGASGIIKVWDAKSFRLLHTLGPTSGAVRALTISPDGKTLASASPNGQKGSADSEFGIIVWDLATGERVRTISHPPPTFGMTALAYMPDGEQIVSAQDRAFRVLKVPTGEIAKTIDLPNLSRSLGCVALHPDGRRLASGVFEPKIRLWDTQSWKDVLAWDAHHQEAPPQRGVASIAFSPDGSYVISGGMDGMVCVWEASSGRRLVQVDARGEASRGRVTGIAMTPDNGLLAASHFGGTATVWRIKAD